MGEISTVTPWIRFFSNGHTTQVGKALAVHPALVRERPARTWRALVDELGGASRCRVVVLDSHGWADKAGVGRLYAEAPEHTPSDLASEAVLDQCDLLILGGCYQAAHLREWAVLAPHAVIAGARDEVPDVAGCEVIAEIVQAAQSPGAVIDASAVDRMAAGRFGFTAVAPMRRRPAGAEV